MDAQAHLDVKPRVQVSFRLGSEIYAVSAANSGALSQQLVSMKVLSMTILKDFITKHNAPTDVPDDLVEPSSEEDEDDLLTGKHPKKSKKSKLN